MPDKNFHIITFGCQMNVHDSRWLAGALAARGFVQTPLEQARIVILNTCSVREKPEQKVKTALGRVQSLTGGDPDVLVAVTGCVAQQLGQKLFEGNGQVRLVAGSDGINDVPGAIERLLGEPRLRLSLLDFTSRYVEREPAGHSRSHPVAYVNIMQGCDNFCAYCIVPYTRGRQKSRAATAILDECRALLGQGAREITLLGQNVNAYGRDKSGDGTSFADILAQVAALPGLERLRYVTPHPKDMKPADIEAFSSLAPLCPRLHLPVQAGADRVLARMGRKYDSQDFLDLVAILRKTCPDLALSTDIIVGFPGESEEDFDDTLEMVKTCGFMSAFSFCYSDRPGTRAALFPDKVAPERKQERLLRLQALQEELSARWLNDRVGQKTCLLIETRSPRQLGGEGETLWQGRDPYGALAHVVLPSGADHTGRMVPVVITRAGKHSLSARLEGDIW
ncbi:MAG: tRNA (N6-isopentenyl adenosine(37)-C2)-methylthiotransferase MiaB [Desulfovibrio sp.]|jgi:tRNA-2-methylthio-N6-dimethylallyladenosine synthase|nr:tRNA (N6-isopentenyl adenosine(37)-C2)-methylthiotransferase MiaB [Desulfovibrio sp.]